MSIAAAVAGAFSDDAGGAEFIVPRREARRRLWDLAVRHHCVLLGAAFDLGELRRLFRRAGYGDWRTAGEYEVHCTAVCRANSRNDLSTLMQKSLEERFAAAVSRFDNAATALELLQRWRTLASEGEAVAAYWAALTHPAWDSDLDESLSREMHMIAHQEFSARRATLRRMRQLEERLAQAEEQLADAKQAKERLRLENAAQQRQSGVLEAELRQARTELERWHSGETADALRARQAELEAALRRALAEGDELRRTLRRLERANGSSRPVELQSGTILEQTVPKAAPEPACRPDVCGRRVLCIGGKTNLMPQYRALVEDAGGEFSHHDGGVENHVGRLPAMLAAAEVVICLAADCSHAAYRLAKRYCKAKGKPCMLVGGSSVTALARCVGKNG